MASGTFIKNIADLQIFIVKIKSQIPEEIYEELSKKWDTLRDLLIDLKECPVHSLDLQHFPKPKKCAWFKDCTCQIDPCKYIRPDDVFLNRFKQR
jgi:hypothetical protein